MNHDFHQKSNADKGETYVTHHAKASTAGSSMRQGSRLGRIFRGAIATRGISRRAKGSSAPSTPRCALAALAATAALLAFAPSALALTHPFQSSFGPDGTSGTTFSNPQSLAVDQSTGDLYVLDVGAGSLQKFDSSGTPANFSALASNTIGGFGFDSPSAAEVAVDNSGGATDGDVYVASFAGIDIYASDGTHLGSLTQAGGSGFGEACGVAVSPNGDVYVGDFGGNVDRYIPDGANNPVNDTTDYDSQITGVSSPCNVAASNSKLYASTWSEGPLTAYDTADFPGADGSFDASSAGTVVDANSKTAYLDPATADLYVDEGTGIAQFDSAGSLLGRFGGAELSSSRGVAVRGSTNFVYAADSNSNQVSIYGAGFTPAPVITSAVIFNLTPTETTIRSNLDDGAAQPSDCHFEYGTDTSYGTSVPCAQTPAPAADPVAVSAHLGALTPGTTYHYRLVATTSGGTTEGPDATFTTPNPSTPSCTNDALRSGLSASLPDCRAYEQVSPTDKDGQNVFSKATQTRISPSGDSVFYSSLGGFGDANGLTVLTSYLGERGATAWQSHNVFPTSPSTSVALITAGMGPTYYALNDSLTAGAFYSPASLTNDPNTEDIGNYYLRNDLTTPGPGSYQLASPCPVCSAPLEPPTPFNAHQAHHVYVGASADLSHLVFESPRQLTAGAPGDCAGDNVLDRSLCPLKLYDFHDGTLDLASVLPNGSPAAGQVGDRSLDEGISKAPRAVSADGSRIVFQGADGNLYQRVNDTTTVELNASEKTNGSGPGGTDPDGPQPAGYGDASADGTRVFFTSSEELTNDADTHTGGGGFPEAGLYMYDANAPAGHHLTFISADQSGTPALGATGVLGASADGHYVYWMEFGRLVANQPGEELLVDKPDLYVWHDGTVGLVSTLAEGGAGNGDILANGNGEGAATLESRVSPDGRSLLFTNSEQTGPTGVPQSFHRQLYLYRFADNSLVCASCRPSGSSMSSAGVDTVEDPQANNTATPYYLSHALSADGRYVFFNTTEKLVPEDTNGANDAYEYDSQSGQVHLLSTGADPSPSYFLDATPDGSNVVIDTFQGLVNQDADGGADAYDVRVNGGLAAQNQPPPPPPCTDAASCQGAGSGAPGTPGSGTSSFTGPGNQGKNLGGTTGPPKKKKKCRKHRKCKHSRRANTNRGGSK